MGSFPTSWLHSYSGGRCLGLLYKVDVTGTDALSLLSRLSTNYGSFVFLLQRMFLLSRWLRAAVTASVKQKIYHTRTYYVTTSVYFCPAIHPFISMCTIPTYSSLCANLPQIYQNILYPNIPTYSTQILRAVYQYRLHIMKQPLQDFFDLKRSKKKMQYKCCM